MSSLTFSLNRISKEKAGIVMFIRTSSFCLFISLISMFLDAKNPANGAVIISENLGASSYSASGFWTQDTKAEFAFDGLSSTGWNNGGHPLAWIEVDLGDVREIESFRLVVVQSPAGSTTHQIWVSNTPIQAYTSSASLVHTFSQYTSHNDTLSFTPTNLLYNRYVQIRTTASPSWVSWYEVQVFGTSNNSAVPEPTSAAIISVLLGGAAFRASRRRLGA